MRSTPRHIERSKDAQTWDTFIGTIKTLTDGYTPIGQSDLKMWSINDATDTLRLDEYKGKPESIVLRGTVQAGDDDNTPESHRYAIQDTTMTLSFSSTTGFVNKMRMNTELGTVSFDNGIRRGYERKSSHFKLHLRQEFSLDGKPKLLDISKPEKGSMELSIEAKIFEGLNTSETLKNVSYYGIQDGKLVPLSDTIADLTRSRVDLVHEIIEARAIDSDGQIISNAPFGVPEDSKRGSDVIARSETSKPAYTIRVHKETLEVLLDGNYIGEVRVTPFLDPVERVQKIISSCWTKASGIRE